MDITKVLMSKSVHSNIPVSATFELTPVCNMNCKMCYVRMSKAEQMKIQPLKEADEWIKLAKKLADNGLLYLLITGGEPFLYPDLRYLLTELKKLGLVLSINTNGTLIGPEEVKWLKELGISKINITVYGSSNETYERLCSNPQGFSQVERAVRLLREEDINVKINFSVTDYNKADMEQVVAFANQYDCLVQPVAYMFPPVRKDSFTPGTSNRMEPEEAMYQHIKINVLMDKEKDKRRVQYRKQLSDIEQNGIESIFHKFELPEQGEKMKCSGGRSSFWITWTGNVSLCGMMKPTTTNAFSHEVSEIKDTLNDKLESIQMPAQCTACGFKEICKPCAAVSYAESGSYSEIPEYRCEMMRNYGKALKRADEELYEGGLSEKD